MEQVIHWMDRKYLVSFNTDITNQKFLKEYFGYRSIWERAGNKGELEQATLLSIAAKYQKAPPKPQVAEEELEAATA